MKILLFSLLLALGSYASEVVYGSKSGIAPETTRVVDVAAGESIEILNSSFSPIFRIKILVQHEKLPQVHWQTWTRNPMFGIYKLYSDDNNTLTLPNNTMVGPCSIFVAQEQGEFAWQVSYKITKPSAANTTTSAPILLPPSQDAAQRWFVRLQVSSDLKTWQDVQPGEFLGSDTARFFRIQTSASN